MFFCESCEFFKNSFWKLLVAPSVFEEENYIKYLKNPFFKKRLCLKRHRGKTSSLFRIIISKCDESRISKFSFSRKFFPFYAVENKLIIPKTFLILVVVKLRLFVLKDTIEKVTKMNKFNIFWNNRLGLFCKVIALKHFANLTGLDPHRIVFFTKVAESGH